MRITEELPRLHITTENRIRFGIACACRVYTSAEYRAWAGRWVSGADRTEAAARTARAAVRAARTARTAAAAAWAARAAVRAAEVAAAAAWAAEVAAETAAEAAAWAAEVAAAAARTAEVAAKAAVGLPLCDLAAWAVGNDDLTAIL